MKADITSTANPTIQQLKALQGKKGRREQRAFLLEGGKLIGEALSSGIAPDLVLHTGAAPDLLARLESMGAQVFTAAPHALGAVCDTKTPQGICARFPLPAVDPPAAYDGLWVALDGLQDPGNVGTIIRTADAMGARGVLLGEGCAEAYSPKVVRAAMGSLFHLCIAEAPLLRELPRMKEHGYCLLAGDLQGEDEMPPLPGKTAVLIGSEGRGLDAQVAALADIRCRIDMPGAAESLNAAVASAILLYEVSRHRRGG